MNYYQTTPIDIKKAIIGRVTRNETTSKNNQYILITDTCKPYYHKSAVVLTSESGASNESKIKKVIFNIPKPWLDSIDDGDVISIEPNGSIKVIWEINSAHNVIFVTGRCNCHCIMCPQPASDDPYDLHMNNMKILQIIEKNSLASIALTGGEPTIYLDRCIQIIKKCKQRFPGASIDFLTNGRLLTSDNIFKLVSVNHKNIRFCIPIHADNSSGHDGITQCPGSFSDTINAIQNLALYNQKVELRVVITKYNYRRLPSISEFIYRNFPFSMHVAFMGMEVCGLAEENKDDVWIDPFEYRNELCEAVKHLYRRNINVSIYNIPLCLLPPNYWRFAADSISEWKKGYGETCYQCKVKTKCPGIFLTSKIQSKFITRLEN